MVIFRYGNPDPSLLLATIKNIHQFSKRSSAYNRSHQFISHFVKCELPKTTNPIELAKRSRATTKSNQQYRKSKIWKNPAFKMKIVKCSEHVSFVCVHTYIVIIDISTCCMLKMNKNAVSEKLFFR